MGITVAVDGEGPERKEARCADGFLRALAARLFCLGNGNPVNQTQAPEPTPPTSPIQKKCGGCGKLVEEFGRGSRGVQLCRPCIRLEDEERLGPFSEEERRGLDLVSQTLDSVSWRFWKPGEQPAQLLDWLYLGDLRDVLNWDLLNRKGINAVLNLINWWELTALLPEDIDLQYAFATQDVLYNEVDSEDRLFFNIVDSCWPAAEKFLEKCRTEGKKVIVNCAAGHNRSACMVVCWLHMREKMTLLQAIEHVQQRRGTILSNHGFRHQLVRLALKDGRLGEPSAMARRMCSVTVTEPTDGQHLQRIIRSKRTSAKYDIDSETTQDRQPSVATSRRKSFRARRGSISDKMVEGLSQRKLSMELVACLVHADKSFTEDYVFTSNPPTVIGSGFSGDVVLCRRKESSFDDVQALRCVKRFCHAKMVQEHLQKLMNEAVIYLSLEHPLVSRLFDVYENEAETSLVMQYCAGGTLEDVLEKRGSFSEKDFKKHAVQMLRAVAYIHSAGIVHRDIKPRNWVFEADYGRIKLIDFGFSVKTLVASEDDQDGFGSLKGCLGTLGYLAPEVVHDRTDSGYSEKCDIWSLGVVFFELLTAEHAFHREAGTCEGYTQEVTLREIEEVSTESLEKLLRRVPAEEGTRAFLGSMLTKDPAARPSALELLRDPYLAEARATLATPQSSLSKGEVLRRFQAYGEASAPTRASMLAMARSPTRLPWSEFEMIRATYDLFDSKNLTGAINREAWLSVVAPNGSGSQHASDVWESVVGEQESLSYCEFLAALLPLIEDAFEDASPEANSQEDLSPARGGPSSWNLSMPISSFLPLLKSKRVGKPPIGDMIFNEDTPVSEVVRSMTRARFRWVIIRYHRGNHSFFDYMDINHRLVSMRKGTGNWLSSALSSLCGLPVGQVANCSGYSEFVPVGPNTSLRDVLQLLCGSGRSNGGHANVHRVPIVAQGGQVVEVFSCLSFLELAMRFPGPRAILASRGASIFDCRNSILESSAETKDTVISGLQVMDEQHLTICPATSRELSGSMGGVAVVGVISVSDLKWVMHTGNFSILDSSIGDFLTWRTEVAKASESQVQRDQGRYKCISVDAEDSLYILATKLLASRLQRIFLSSEEIGRIIGVVSSRDILVEVFGELELQSGFLNESIVRCCSVSSAGST